MSRAERRFGIKAARRIRRERKRQEREDKRFLKAIKVYKGENRHHKRCQSNGGKLMEGDVCNISVVNKDQHSMWHQLFSNLLPPTICEIINQKWLDPRWQFVCVLADTERKQ